MAQTDIDLPETAPRTRGGVPSGAVPEPEERLPRWLALLAWALPIGGLLVAAVAVGALAWRWSRAEPRSEPDEADPLEPELERRLDAELARFE